MAEIGKIQELQVLKQVDFGFYLDGEELGELLLPIRYAPEDLEEGPFLEVFIYLDSDDRPICTTEVPFVTIGQVAHLKTVDTSQFGAFLDWGLSKDLLVPFKEQRVPMEIGRYYTVILYIDKTGRIAATSRLSDHLIEEDHDKVFNLHEEVDLHIASRSDMGFRAVINGTHLGLIHNIDIFQKPAIGDKCKGFIKSITKERRINLSLQNMAPEMRMELRGDLVDQILGHLKDNDGTSTLTDKSAPDEIYSVFNVSKSNYKKAVGQLYKAGKINLKPGIIKLKI